jgi:hypothetical protein
VFPCLDNENNTCPEVFFLKLLGTLLFTNAVYISILPKAFMGPMQVVEMKNFVYFIPQNTHLLMSWLLHTKTEFLF